MGRQPSVTRLATSVVLVLTAVVTGCGPRNEVPHLDHPRGRVLILALDGTSPRLVEKWMKSGDLPNLRSLAEEGSWGKIRGDYPILSPRRWTTVATGKRADQHGIKGWVEIEKDGEKKLYRSSQRRCAALWNIASAAGLKVGTVNWLATQPPEKINGVMISELATPDRRRGLQQMGRNFGWKGTTPKMFSISATWPPEWMARVAEIAARADTFPGIGLPPLELVRKIRKDDELVARTALAVERDTHPDLLMVLLQGNDRTSHFYWCGVEDSTVYPAGLRPGALRRSRAAACMHDYYRFTDFLVGRFLARFGPDDLVIVMSDHGFEPNAHGKDLRISGVHETEAAVDGVLFVRGPGIPAGGTFKTEAMVDVTPTVLAWLGLPVGRDMSGRVFPFLDQGPPRKIHSYDFIPIERVKVKTGPMDDEIMERLKSLGYIN